MPLHVSSTCAYHQEVKIALHSLWYHHTYRWPSSVLCVDDRLVRRSICSCIAVGHLHFDLLMMSTYARNTYRHEIKLIVEQILCIKLVK